MGLSSTAAQLTGGYLGKCACRASASGVGTSVVDWNVSNTFCEPTGREHEVNCVD